MPTRLQDFPTEMLALIIEEAWHGHDVDPVSCASKDQLPEISISHVCRAWRSIALGFSKLWSEYAYRNNKIHARELDRLTTYLERSHNHPLDLWFVLIPYSWEFFSLENRALELFRKATAHAHRWRRVSLDAQGKDGNWRDNLNRLTQIFQPLQNLPFPNLEAFEVYTPQFPGNVLLNNLFDPEEATPRLSFVRMDPTSFSQFVPPLNITTLELHWEYGDYYPLMPISLDALCNFIESPTLVSLSISGKMFETDVIDHSIGNVKFRSSNLKNFRCSDAECARIVWSYIRFPQLELVIFRASAVEDVWQYSLDKNQDAFPALRTLVLVNCECLSLESLVSLSEFTKNITHLYVVEDGQYMEEDPFDHGDRSVFALMMKESPHTILWPNLNILTVSRALNCEPSIDQVKSYIDIVQCRPQKCILRLPRYNADLWQSTHPTAWCALHESGLVETIPADPSKSVANWVPWPSREIQGFRRLSRDPFFDPFPEEDY